MAARSKVSQPRFVESSKSHQAWFSSVKESNQGKARVACRDSLAVIKLQTRIVNNLGVKSRDLCKMEQDPRLK